MAGKFFFPVLTNLNSDSYDLSNEERMALSNYMQGLNPSILVHQLNEEFSKAKGKSKFKVLRNFITAILSSSPSPGPATFTFHCLESAMKVGSPSDETLSYILTSAYINLNSKHKQDSDVQNAQILACELFFKVLNQQVSINSRVLVKIVNAYNITINDLESFSKRNVEICYSSSTLENKTMELLKTNSDNDNLFSRAYENDKLLSTSAENDPILITNAENDNLLSRNFENNHVLSTDSEQINVSNIISENSNILNTDSEKDNVLNTDSEQINVLNIISAANNHTSASCPPPFQSNETNTRSDEYDAINDEYSAINDEQNANNDKHTAKNDEHSARNEGNASPLTPTATVNIQNVREHISTYINQLVTNKMFKSVVELAQQLQLYECIDEKLMEMLVKEGQASLFVEWVYDLKEEKRQFLINKCVEFESYKEAYMIVKQFQLEDAFPHVRMLYKQSSIRKMIKKGAWEIAESYVRDDSELQKYLVRLAGEMGEHEKMNNFCILFDLEAEDNVEYFESRRCQFLQLKDFVPEQNLIFVNSAESLAKIENILKKWDRIGIDCEWKPNHTRGQNENKVSTLQIACEDHVFIIDVLNLSMIEIKPLNSFIKNIFHDENILKLGYGIKEDLKKLFKSFPKIVNFNFCSPVIDLQKSFPEKDKKGGLASLCQLTLNLPLDKSLRMSDWEKRPLSKQQLHYAALDAYCLIKISEFLFSEYLTLNGKEKTEIHLINCQFSFDKKWKKDGKENMESEDESEENEEKKEKMNKNLPPLSVFDIISFLEKNGLKYKTNILNDLNYLKEDDVVNNNDSNVNFINDDLISKNEKNDDDDMNDGEINDGLNVEVNMKRKSFQILNKSNLNDLPNFVKNFQFLDIFETFLSEIPKVKTFAFLLSSPLNGESSKNMLQELCASLGQAYPVYETEMFGRMHAPMFLSQVKIFEHVFYGKASSKKKSAEALAAEAALTGIFSEPADLVWVSSEEGPKLGVAEPNHGGMRKVVLDNFKMNQASNEDIDSCQELLIVVIPDDKYLSLSKVVNALRKQNRFIRRISSKDCVAFFGYPSDSLPPIGLRYETRLLVDKTLKNSNSVLYSTETSSSFHSDEFEARKFRSYFSPILAPAGIKNLFLSVHLEALERISNVIYVDCVENFVGCANGAVTISASKMFVKFRNSPPKYSVADIYFAEFFANGFFSYGFCRKPFDANILRSYGPSRFGSWQTSKSSVNNLMIMNRPFKSRSRLNIPILHSIIMHKLIFHKCIKI